LKPQFTSCKAGELRFFLIYLKESIGNNMQVMLGYFQAHENGWLIWGHRS
jgi:hypothetical protein